MGFAARGIDTTTGPTFKASWWLTDLDRDASQPNNVEFCAPTANECDKDQRVTPTDPSVRGEPDGPCLHQSKAGLYDLKCFWHSTSIWRKDCPAHCGHGDTRYDPDPVKFPNPPDGDGGPNHWEVWLRDLDGYKVVLASPDGTADGAWRPRPAEGA